MFGYINIVKDELKVKEYNLFKAYYCSLCKSQGKLLGQFTRFALSYDFAVLALLLDSIIGQPIINGAKRCLYSPLKKHPLAGRDEVISYCANMSVALTYFKLKDNSNDESNMAYKLAAGIFSIPINKVKKAYPKKFSFINACLDDLSRLEKENCKNIDQLADTSGRLMAEIFCPPLELEQSAIRALKQTGYDLGRWLYIIDAIDDFEDDKKKGRFNPFVSKEQILEYEQPLWFNLSHASLSYELLDLKGNKSIMDNIIYYGLHASTQKVIDKINSYTA